MDLFDKCTKYTRADEVKASGMYPYFRAIEANEGPVVKIEGRDIIMAGSNNYLGLTAHPKVKEAAIEAIKNTEPDVQVRDILPVRLIFISDSKRSLQIFLAKNLFCFFHRISDCTGNYPYAC